MAETQILAIAISLSVSFLAVMIGVLINNNRLNDVKDLLAAKIETRAAANELSELRSETRGFVAELKSLIEKNHSELLLKITEVENRRVHP